MKSASRSAAAGTAVAARIRAISVSASSGRPCLGPSRTRSDGTISLGKTVMPSPARSAACWPAKDGLV